MKHKLHDKRHRRWKVKQQRSATDTRRMCQGESGPVVVRQMTKEELARMKSKQ